jgi:RISC-loading complex subunit TARBP2
MANESGETSSMQGKTPISYLQELCNKRGITPQYDLIANEGAVHEPLFVFKVSAGELIGTGKGTSKKKAKHNAAVSLLTQMGSLPAANTASGLPANNNGTAENHFSLESKDVDARNPVGELQEMTQKRSWPPPVYEFASEIGPAHAREFVCNVRLFNVCEQAVGKSKKLAKRNAALVMLEAIQQGGIEPNIPVMEPEEYCDDETIPIYDALTGNQPKHLMSSCDYNRRAASGGVDGDADKVRKKISPMFQMLSKKTKLGPLLEGLQNLSDNDLGAGDVCQRLEDLGREQKFAVRYIDMAHLSLSGKHQCIVELSTNPVTACLGSSTSVEDAHVEAALNALRYCKIMTTRTNI